MGDKTLPVAFSGAVLIFFILLLAFSKWGPAIPFSVSSVTTTKTNLFTVSADGQAFAAPDVAQVNLGFTTNGSTVGQVQNQANQTINKISADLKGQGIAAGDIRTTSYNLRPDYDFTASRQTIKGYVVDVNIQVKVRDFNKINGVIDTGTADGANQVSGLSFTLDDATAAKAENEARSIAISKAREKANQIASETGITLGRIVDVSENNQPTPRPLMMAQAAGIGSADKSAPTQIEPGTSEISVTVTLGYETR